MTLAGLVLGIKRDNDSRLGGDRTVTGRAGQAITAPQLCERASWAHALLQVPPTLG